MEQKTEVYTLPENTGLEIRKMVIGLCIFIGVMFVIGGLVFANAHTIAKNIPFEAEQRFVGPYERLIGEHYDGTVNTEMDAYLQNLADGLSGAMDLPKEYEIKLHYIESDTQNAFATLGGHIFVFSGLVDMMPDENSLAMVIAHEIAHIENRDPAASLGRGFAISLIYSFVMSGDSRSAELSDFGANVGLSVFSRKQEQAADIAAIDGLVGYYGHARGYDQFFVQMRDKMLQEGETEYPEWLSSHPDLKHRIDYLEAYLIEKQYQIGEATAIDLGDITKK